MNCSYRRSRTLGALKSIKDLYFWMRIFIPFLGLLLIFSIVADITPAANEIGPSPTTEQAIQSDTPSNISFAVKFADGQFRKYELPDFTDQHFIGPIEDDKIRAFLNYLGNYHWELSLTVKKGIATNIWFPWQDKALPLNGDITDDLVMYPYLMGVARRAESLRSYAWGGLDYPGPCISPLIIITDSQTALITAATNWPPCRVKPLYCREGMALMYTKSVGAGEQATFKALLLCVRLSSLDEVPPWQVALDHYKNWLETKMWESDLFRVAAPEWMWNSHGFLNVQLENMPAFDARLLRERWGQWKDSFPWVQFWGQMSNYAGPANIAVPSLKDEEQTGCCLPSPRIHIRYQPDLLELVSEIAEEGHIGFYARPKDDKPLDDAGEEFLIDWLQKNADYGANAFYIDVLGAGFFGDPLEIAIFLRDQCPPATFIEYPVDIYPTAFLISGSLSGGNWAGVMTTLPEFGRYLLDDRLLFLGQSNGDHAFWGPENDYWTERQAFLLGAKFDIITISDNKNAPKQMNRAVEYAILERNRVSWWDRRPIYLNRNGITDVPEGVEIRKFQGKSGESLLVIDNWHQHKGAQFRHKGNWIMIPSRPLSILVQ